MRKKAFSGAMLYILKLCILYRLGIAVLFGPVQYATNMTVRSGLHSIGVVISESSHSTGEHWPANLGVAGSIPSQGRQQRRGGRHCLYAPSSVRNVRLWASHV